MAMPVQIKNIHISQWWDYGESVASGFRYHVRYHELFDLRWFTSLRLRFICLTCDDNNSSKIYLVEILTRKFTFTRHLSIAKVILQIWKLLFLHPNYQIQFLYFSFVLHNSDFCTLSELLILQLLFLFYNKFKLTHTKLD